MLHGGERIKLGSVYGIIDTMYCRSQFTPTSFQGMTEVNVNKVISIRVCWAARAESIGEDLGIIRCSGLKNLCLG